MLFSILLFAIGYYLFNKIITRFYTTESSVLQLVTFVACIPSLALIITGGWGVLRECAKIFGF